jgi:ubiquinone/menaquinone biosynthesis C-methylase UbiE
MTRTLMRTIHTPAISDGASVARENTEKPDAALPVATMNCDRIAPVYRTAEYASFGGALQACRVMYLRDVAECRKALVCGDGDGRFLAELLRANREVRVDYVDLSAGMARLARQKVESIGAGAIARTLFHVGDVREFNLGDGAAYDLITAHFFLDCFDDAEATRVAGKLASFAESGATLLVSDFRIPPGGVGRYLSAAIVRGLYAGFRVATGLRVNRLPNYERALGSAGFEKQREELKLGGLLSASLWRKN